jgi:hypothetical protein
MERIRIRQNAERRLETMQGYRFYNSRRVQGKQAAHTNPIGAYRICKASGRRDADVHPRNPSVNVTAINLLAFHSDLSLAIGRKE